MRISPLPPEVVAHIAAGEVVERPASVVKELVENALDAGASRVSVEMVGGGLQMIRVVDNGCGMEPEDLELALARHATSKVRTLADLEHIATLGFRGEALAAIAAVSELVLASRPPHATRGAWVRAREGIVVGRGWRGMGPGTEVTVHRLFQGQPARRKFLRSASAEAQAAAQVVAHYALAYPHVSFSLTVDGRRQLQSTGSGCLRDAVSAVYGPEVAAALLEVEGEYQGIRVEGLVSPPSLHRGNRTHVSFFVNGRWVHDRRLPHVLEEAYHGLLPSGRCPIAVVHLWLAPEEVDVNVHPTKAQVRFRDEAKVASALVRAVRAVLLSQAPAPSISISQPGRGGGSQWRTSAAVMGSQQPLTRALPILRVVGQVASLYIVAEGPDGMYLIDQHAAHERVLYEELVARRASRQTASQPLLQPLTVELSTAEEAVLRRWGQELAAYGLEIEHLGDRCYLVRAVPQGLVGGDVESALRSLLDRLEGGGSAPDRVAAAIACHAAVRAGQALSIDEMRELIRRLEEAQAPHTCPHGRPTMVQISAEALARQFGRR